jgi:sugar lactone lactonase YvrE
LIGAAVGAAVFGVLLAGCDVFGGEDDDADGPDEPIVELFAEGLVAPVGIEVDAQGRLWVAEQGLGEHDSRISLIGTDGQVQPAVTDLPSDTINGDVIGAWRAYLRSDGSALLMVQGQGTDSLSTSVLSADLTGVSLDDLPLDTSDVEVLSDIGTFVLDEQGFEESNPYALSGGPGGDLLVVDAAANALLRRDDNTGELSVFSTFDDVSNPTSVGPPTMDAVPTDIVSTGTRFFVSALTGFPFPEGQARIYEVDAQGAVSVFQGGFTTLVDLAIDARDGTLLALQFASFDPQSGFQPQTGQLLETDGTTIDTLVTGLNFPSGMHTRSRGELFISSLADGDVLRVRFP